MTVLLYHPGELVEFTPPGSRHTYHLKVPAQYEASRIRAAAKVLGGRWWGELDVARALRDELARVLEAAEETDEESLTAVGAWLEAAEAAFTTWQGERNDENWAAYREAIQPTPEVKAIDRVVYGASKSYRTLYAERDEWTGYYAQAAAAKCLIGWESDCLPPFRRKLAGVPDEILGLIPEDDLLAIGGRVAELVAPPEAMEKNSGSASSGSTSPTSSPASSTPPESGPSPETTASTPGSSSESQPSTSTLPIS